MDLLVATDRIPEAALFARTYMPSLIGKVVKLWREALLKDGKRKMAEAIADPIDNADLFHDMDYAVVAEDAFKRRKERGFGPASEYVGFQESNEWDLIGELKKRFPDGVPAEVLATLKAQGNQPQQRRSISPTRPMSSASFAPMPPSAPSPVPMTPTPVLESPPPAPMIGSASATPTPSTANLISLMSPALAPSQPMAASSTASPTRPASLLSSSPVRSSSGGSMPPRPGPPKQVRIAGSSVSGDDTRDDVRLYLGLWDRKFSNNYVIGVFRMRRGLILLAITCRI